MTKPTTILILLIISLFFITSNCEAKTRYVNTASDGGDGTTNNLTGGTAAYASLFDWEATEDGIELTEPMIVYCEGTDADTTAVTIDEWTGNDATNTIKITTTQTNRHNGKWNTGKYRLVPSGDFHSIIIEENFTKIEGLQIATYDATNRMTVEINANEVDVSYCILRGTNNTNQSGIDARSTGPYYFWNNIIYDFPGRGIYADISGNAYVYNNTVYNCGAGIKTAWHDIIAKNNITQSCTDGYLGTFNPSSDYNISDVDGDAPNVNFGGGFATVTFVDENGNDFRLSGSDTAAKDQGTNSVSPINFTDDIQGQSRNWGAAGGSWDIGADENIEVDVIIGAY